jgi:hypothetical protein
MSERITPFRKAILEALTELEITGEKINQAVGFCFMSKSQAKRAKCTTNGELPNYANRSEELCSICGNFGVTDDRKPYWQVRYDAHEKTYKNARTETLKYAAKKGMQLCKRMLNEINLRRY